MSYMRAMRVGLPDFPFNSTHFDRRPVILPIAENFQYSDLER